ncbi:hypothetical protein EDD16DRAFT_1523370 [Pisolithus croceorrhizus]|nr:hypothetical protein EDD16DRAFT_1523370 [Pisolithus croceorrhizus]KAI6143162.1 hypothetical protein EDD17DRAFT_1515625 [Pisolithus thermaeus]
MQCWKYWCSDKIWSTTGGVFAKKSQGGPSLRGPITQKWLVVSEVRGACTRAQGAWEDWICTASTEYSQGHEEDLGCRQWGIPEGPREYLKGGGVREFPGERGPGGEMKMLVEMLYPLVFNLPKKGNAPKTSLGDQHLTSRQGWWSSGGWRKLKKGGKVGVPLLETKLSSRPDRKTDAQKANNRAGGVPVWNIEA